MTSKQQIRKLENNYNCVKKIRFENNSSCILQKCSRSVHDVRSCSSRLPLSSVFHTLPAILSIWTRSMHSGPLAELSTSGRATCSDSSGSGFRMVVHRNLWRATSSSKRQRSGKMIFCSSSSLKSKRSTLVIYLYFFLREEIIILDYRNHSFQCFSLSSLCCFAFLSSWSYISILISLYVYTFHQYTWHCILSITIILLRKLTNKCPNLWLIW